MSKLERVCRSSCEVQEQKLTLIITAQLGNSPETVYGREGEERERGDTARRKRRQKSSLLAGGHDFLVIGV